MANGFSYFQLSQFPVFKLFLPPTPVLSEAKVRTTYSGDFRGGAGVKVVAY